MVLCSLSLSTCQNLSSTMSHSQCFILFIASLANFNIHPHTAGLCHFLSLCTPLFCYPVAAVSPCFARFNFCNTLISKDASSILKFCLMTRDGSVNFSLGELQECSESLPLGNWLFDKLGSVIKNTSAILAVTLWISNRMSILIAKVQSRLVQNRYCSQHTNQPTSADPQLKSHTGGCGSFCQIASMGLRK